MAGPFLVYFPVVLQVTFITDDHERERVRTHHHALLKELTFPVRYVVQRSLVSDVVHQEAAVGSSVKGCAKGLVPLLACGVPNLEHNNLPVNSDLLIAKVCSYGWFECFSEVVVFELLNEGGLAHA